MLNFTCTLKGVAPPEWLPDADAVDKWLNLLEGYFSIHDFFNLENITFSLLKSAPHVKDLWETYCERKDKEEPSLFLVVPTWNLFQYAIRENIIPWGAMRTSTSNGLRCGNKEIKMCMS